MNVRLVPHPSVARIRVRYDLRRVWYLVPALHIMQDGPAARDNVWRFLAMFSLFSFGVFSPLPLL
jgi:hypothetical protein